MLIVGFGNPLAGDDGAGPEVISLLRGMPALPSDVRLEDGGTDALRLPALWRGEPRVWLVDALARGASPGTLHRLEHDELLALPQRHIDAHRLALPECLRLIAIAHPDMAGVRYVAWGIEPKDVRPAAGLALEVARAARRLAEVIVAALAAAGADVPAGGPLPDPTGPR